MTNQDESPIVACQANLELDFGTPDLAKVAFAALLPESVSISSDRASASLRVEGPILFIDIDAEDLTALRASMNSYLAWASSCQQTFEILESLSQ
ncbi:MAG: hypothetical protein GF411_17385 [Candidatus Lokiarchaeota archaeon]|nr:hypothetical protein [Candidatus Lokiarchaeota archaeon]